MIRFRVAVFWHGYRSRFENAMLAKRALHFVIHVPAFWQELGLNRLQKVLSPQLDEFFELSVVSVICALRSNRSYDFLTVGIGLLTIREPLCPERILVAEFQQSKCSLQILHRVSIYLQRWGYHFPYPSSFAFSKGLIT